ncbi:alpha-(1,3)-fucosyltransferase 7-like [Lytechinus variegatus]|uniref:alpha-(1,3)-fucosyltransferase 7-like n=1 Tax=Lytechinus variegatus TaxID=7654 RepID=UPI001BB2AB6B|nr:alpha-(1,3)-fucosyltransferase 7-like [Lytechinus variegatus]
MRTVKRKILIISAFTCLSLGGIYILFIRNGKHIEEVTLLAKRQAAKTLDSSFKGGNAKENIFVPRNKTRQDNGPCYRQVQIWRGAKTPQTPGKFQCPGLKCGIKFVEDTSFETLKSSDAVIFYHFWRWNWAELQRRRPMNQAWVFYSIESPKLTGRSSMPPRGFDRLYNFTMSYRPSSTIHSPYGYYDTTVPQVTDKNRNWAQGKSELIAWAASNHWDTTWRRTKFVQTLSKYISVDMYGACGNKVCNIHSAACIQKLKAHKFYLSLENAECRDYITEKFWKNALLRDILPIVYGPPREDYERVAPPNSFIHLQDFKDFNELVDYIKLLDSNDTLYNSYFEWKTQGSIQIVGEAVILGPHFLCEVVAKLLEQEKKLDAGYEEASNRNPSMHDYWSTSCFKSTGFPHDF